MRLRFRFSQIIGLLLLIVLLVSTTAGPFMLPDPLEINVKAALQSPSAEHLLGTDVLGRDVFSRLCSGGRYSLMISLLAAAISLILGITLGCLAGWFGGFLNSFFDRFFETVMCIPGIILALLLAVFLGRGADSILAALAISGAVYVARLTRAEIQITKEAGFVEAAVLAGIPKARIFLYHLLPNILGPLLAYSAVLLGSNILAESSLSFLGLGVQPPEPSWGAMLYEARNFLTTAPWLALAPGMAIFLTVFSFNLLGDWLGKYLNPIRYNRQTVAGGIKSEQEPVGG